MVIRCDLAVGLKKGHKVTKLPGRKLKPSRRKDVSLYSDSTFHVSLIETMKHVFESLLLFAFRFLHILFRSFQLGKTRLFN